MLCVVPPNHLNLFTCFCTRFWTAACQVDEISTSAMFLCNIGAGYQLRNYIRIYNNITSIWQQEMSFSRERCPAICLACPSQDLLLCSGVCESRSPRKLLTSTGGIYSMRLWAFSEGSNVMREGKSSLCYWYFFPISSPSHAAKTVVISDLTKSARVSE